ncbi:MAG: hypothetical protein AAFQ82_21355, partial [Myxococcota bacterium]
HNPDGSVDPAGTPSSAPQPEAPPRNEAFGFTEAPVQEKYNTEYIVKNMQKGERTTQYVVIGLVVAALAGAGLWLMLMPEAEAPALPSAKETAPADPAPPESPSEGEKTE